MSGIGLQNTKGKNLDYYVDAWPRPYNVVAQWPHDQHVHMQVCMHDITFKIFQKISTSSVVIRALRILNGNKYA